jgi:hypothetical protein
MQHHGQIGKGWGSVMRRVREAPMYPTDPVATAAYYRMTAIVYVESAKMLEAAFVAKGEKIPGNRMAIPIVLDAVG